jgi:hypothetical protein
MQELAELLNASEVSDDEIREMLAQAAKSGRGVSRRSSPTHAVGVASRVALVVKRLRDRIQETILIEISADRDAPVPAQYREFVDGYFRTLAGESQPATGGSK